MFGKSRLTFKLIGSFMVVACITFVVGILGWKEISDSARTGDSARLSDTIVSQLLQREIDHLGWAMKVGEIQQNEELTELAVEKDERRCGFGRWLHGEDRKRAEEAMPEIRIVFEQIEQPHRRLHESARALEAILQKGEAHRAEALKLYRDETLDHLQSVRKLLGEIRPMLEKHAVEVRRRADVQVERAKRISFSGMIAGPSIALILGILLSLSITRPIRRVVSGLGGSAEQLSSASEQISATSQQLAEGASEQAAAIEETSASLEEMASMTRQNAQNGDQANALMKTATRITEAVNGNMAQLTGSMAEISKASEDTQVIIRAIDEIAFQTNLLALNAAVEAARAGEAGAGFAVVAEEVRSLAMRTSREAKNTEHLIEGTVKKITAGAQLVGKTHEAFSEVLADVKKLDELMGEIAAASQEQAKGIEEINKAVSEMDKVTQQNAANAEESASASHEMKVQAANLTQFVTELAPLVGMAGNGGQKPAERKRLGPGALSLISIGKDRDNRGASPAGEQSSPRSVNHPRLKGPGRF